MREHSSVIRFSVYLAQIHRSRIPTGEIGIIGRDKHFKIVMKFSITKLIAIYSQSFYNMFESELF